MSDNTQTLQQPQHVSMAVQPHILLGGLALLCVAAQKLVLTWPAFTAVPSFIAATVALLSAGLVAWAARCHRDAGLAFMPFAPLQPLLKTGPYRFTRNPVYVGMAGLLGALAILFSSWLFVVALVAFLAYVHFAFVLPAEARQLAAHGAAWDGYRRLVHRWL